MVRHVNTQPNPVPFNFLCRLFFAFPFLFSAHPDLRKKNPMTAFTVALSDFPDQMLRGSPGRAERLRFAKGEQAASEGAARRIPLIFPS